MCSRFSRGDTLHIIFKANTPVTRIIIKKCERCSCDGARVVEAPERTLPLFKYAFNVFVLYLYYRFCIKCLEISAPPPCHTHHTVQLAGVSSPYITNISKLHSECYYKYDSFLMRTNGGAALKFGLL